MPTFAQPLNGTGTNDMLMVDGGAFAFSVYKSGAAPTVQIVLDQDAVTGTSGCKTLFPDLISASDRTLLLSSSVLGVELPGSVDLPANAASARFCFALSSSSYDWHRVFDIDAQLEGSTKAYSWQSYSLSFNEALSTTSLPPVYGGQNTAPFTITLDVFSVTVEPPSSASDWGFAGSIQAITFPIQVTISPGG